MKRISRIALPEEANFYCDKHPDRECFTRINSMCWYGSKFDCSNLKMNLCDECIGNLYDYILKTFGVAPEFDSMYETLEKVEYENGAVPLEIGTQSGWASERNDPTCADECICRRR